MSIDYVATGGAPGELPASYVWRTRFWCGAPAATYVRSGSNPAAPAKCPGCRCCGLVGDIQTGALPATARGRGKQARAGLGPGPRQRGFVPWPPSGGGASGLPSWERVMGRGVRARRPVPSGAPDGTGRLARTPLPITRSQSRVPEAAAGACPRALVPGGGGPGGSAPWRGPGRSPALLSFPDDPGRLWPPPRTVVDPIREVGGGRAPRQPGQVRKEAAATSFRSGRSFGLPPATV